MNLPPNSDNLSYVSAQIVSSTITVSRSVVIVARAPLSSGFSGSKIPTDQKEGTVHLVTVLGRSIHKVRKWSSLLKLITLKGGKGK